MTHWIRIWPFKGRFFIFFLIFLFNRFGSKKLHWVVSSKLIKLQLRLIFILRIHFLYTFIINFLIIYLIFFVQRLRNITWFYAVSVLVRLFNDHGCYLLNHYSGWRTFDVVTFDGGELSVLLFSIAYLLSVGVGFHNLNVNVSLVLI